MKITLIHDYDALSSWQTKRSFYTSEKPFVVTRVVWLWDARSGINTDAGTSSWVYGQIVDATRETLNRKSRLLSTLISQAESPRGTVNSPQVSQSPCIIDMIPVNFILTRKIAMLTQVNKGTSYGQVTCMMDVEF